MIIQNSDNNLILTELEDFNLYQIFECGQCFRWDRSEDGSYIGVAYGRALKIKQNSDSSVTLFDTTEEDFTSIWYNYFDFGVSYSDIKSKLSCDEVLKKAICFGDGIRILNQELWETVVSFIISASNNIPRIKKIISELCRLFGDKIEYMDNVFYTFPSYEKVSTLSLEDLAPIKAGFRDKYILAAAEAFSNGLCMDIFSELDYETSKKELMKINGIGNKVADCILLFGLAKRNSFPVDVWVKRIMEYCYFDTEQSNDEIRRFAEERFSDLGGYAQQYLFFYARENKIGL
ncbi:MAG: DNA-3-methyladenine glycosylase 2 family protein [Clostridia bacterium]|nr:DNA-3-methyladenine glycosylase 2 family protein [Clostridia bacterium]